MAVDGTFKEKKKKKKIKEGKLGGTKNIAQYHPTSVQANAKTEQSDVKICDGGQHEHDATKKKKKKIKEEKVKKNNLVSCEASVKTAVKTEPMGINSGKRGQEENDVPQKKKKKKNKKEMEHVQEEVMEVKMDGDHLEESRVKKVKKKRDKQMEVNVTKTGEIKKKKKKKEVEVKEEEVDVGNNGEIDKKKKKKRRNIEDEVLNPKAEDGEIKKKRKKTQAHVKTEESEACIGDEPTKKKTKKEKNTSLKTKSNVECVEVIEEKVKTKKKKKLAPVEDDVEEINAQKKKKKRLESIDEGPACVNGMKEKANVTCDVIGKVKTSDQKKKKNIKVKVDDVTEKIKEELVKKKRSKKDRNESTEKDDIVFLSAKPGNQDEVSIDQARRLALQKEIDQESQPEVNVGQWSTAQFDSSERQAKFLRLMGGFKKSSQPITGSTGRANMALGTEGQQTLQQGLLGEFERAQSRHMDFGSRGTGLGFSPPSNKKFAIDVNARKSIRFDD
ncbi:uncharacterized protein knop1 [Misgurnus anguillicaudatus]|uniref:uncharacterized protein knop1 n=1 Tax=Misgurnus anguillicaudatus TaxID=75329 RepID=UPI003CCF43D8